MIKKNLPKLIITSLITLVPIIIGLILWNQLPDQVPMHWDINGNVDRYGSKAVAVFVMPLLLFVIQWVCALVTSLDPKKENISDKTFTLVLWIIPILSLVVHALVYASALGHAISVNIIMPLILGALFIVIGNYMPKCKQSYTVGIKIPWTLNDEENWNKTHRLAGFVWVVGGIIMLVTAFVGTAVISICMLVPMVIIPFVYSYLLYKKNKD